MTVAHAQAGSPTSATGSATAPAPVFPATVTAGNYAVLSVELKAFSATITTPTGWTLLGSATNGSTASGLSTGSTKVVAFGMLCDGTEGGTAVTLAVTAANTAGAQIEVCSRSLTGWTAPVFATGNKVGNSANMSMTTGTQTSVAAGDLMVAIFAINASLGTPSADTWTQTGTTPGTVTNRADVAVTTGNGSRLRVNTIPITSVTTPSGGATAGYTNASSTSGTLAVVRLRDANVTSVTASRATTWNTDAQVTASRATTWNVAAAGLTSVTATRATTWNVKAAATSTRATTWDVLSATSSTRATTWRVRAAVSSTRATTWRVRAAVTGSRATTWDVLAAVSSTRATTWDVLAPVTSTRGTAWRVRAAVTSTKATTWDVLTGVTSSRATTWRCRAAVTGSRATTWNVVSSLISVTSSRATTWRVLARPVSTRATTWRVLGWPTASRATSWRVRAPVTTSRGTTWRALQATSSARGTTWRTLERVDAFRATSWNVVEPAGVVRDVAVLSIVEHSRGIDITPNRRTATIAAHARAVSIDPHQDVTIRSHARTVTIEET